MIITIGRQHGSNGQQIAKALAARLNIPCYGKEIIETAAESSGYSREVLKSLDEKKVASYFTSSPYHFGISTGFNLNMQMIAAQFDAVRELAEKGDCIFLGRCADYILRKRPDLVKIYIMGDEEKRIKVLSERKNIDENTAAKLMKEVDKDRASYYRYYTDQTWGEAGNYDLCIDSLDIGIEGTVDVIELYAKTKLNNT